MEGWKSFALKYLSLSLKSKEKVVSRFPCFFRSPAHTEETRLLSSPPERSAHTGVSACAWRVMASSTSSVTVSTVFA